MNNKFYAVLFIVFLFTAAYIFNTKYNSPKNTFFVQVPLELSVVDEVQDAITTPVINAMLKEEFGIENKEWPIFFFKKQQRLTIYYVNDMLNDIQGKGKKSLFSAFDALPNTLVAPKNVTITSKLDFFGDDKELLGLVALIDDPNKELLHFNTEMKAAMHAANEKYKQEHRVDFYDISKSEKYPFLPHLSIGHLRVNSIEKLLFDRHDIDATVEKIKRRIIEIVGKKLVSLLTKDNQKILFNKLVIYDLKKRECIKERGLS